MRKLMDAINVVDVESTCWRDQPPEGVNSEIIEVGICSLNIRPDGFKIVACDGLLVRPFRSEVSEFCTELTTLTQEQVDRDGKGFPDVIKYIVDNYRTKERPWASYGDYDRNQFERNCRYRNLEYPFGSRHINVKTLVAACMGWDCEVGMDEALKRMRMPLVGTHHRGKDDAMNIAGMLRFILASAHQSMYQKTTV